MVTLPAIWLGVVDGFTQMAKMACCVISLLLCMNGLRNTRIFTTIMASKYWKENSDSLNQKFELPTLEHRCTYL